MRAIQSGGWHYGRKRLAAAATDGFAVSQWLTLNRTVPALSFLIACITFSGSANAEPGFSLSVATDDRFRGRTTSGERPVATGLVSYDDVRGPYVGVAFTALATKDDGIQPLRSVQYIGYAHRVKSGLTFDIGVTNRMYSKYFTGEYARRFTEGYVGVIGRRVSAHVYLSPDYDGHGGNSAYAEVSALLLERGRWSLSSHVGILAPPREPDQRSAKKELDWRLGATRRFDRLAVSLQWVGSGPDHETRRWQSGVLLSASRNF
jgi:uncharacterized protein (TIGR02001 family)